MVAGGLARVSAVQVLVEGWRGGGVGVGVCICNRQQVTPAGTETGLTIDWGKTSNARGWGGGGMKCCGRGQG